MWWRDAQGPQDLADEGVCVLDHPPEEPPVAGAIYAEGERGLVEAAVEHANAPAVERMGSSNGWLDPITDARATEER